MTDRNKAHDMSHIKKVLWEEIPQLSTLKGKDLERAIDYLTKQIFYSLRAK